MIHFQRKPSAITEYQPTVVTTVWYNNARVSLFPSSTGNLLHRSSPWENSQQIFHYSSTSHLEVTMPFPYRFSSIIICCQFLRPSDIEAAHCCWKVGRDAVPAQTVSRPQQPFTVSDISARSVLPPASRKQWTLVSRKGIRRTEAHSHGLPLSTRRLLFL